MNVHRYPRMKAACCCYIISHFSNANAHAMGMTMWHNHRHSLALG